MKNIVTLQCQKKRGEKEPLANTRGLFLFVILGVGFGEAADDDFAGVAALEVFVEDAGGDAGGFGLGEAIDAGADAGEGDALEVVFLSQSHGGIVAGGEQLALAVTASVPDGAYGMNDFLASTLPAVPCLLRGGWRRRRLPHPTANGWLHSQWHQLLMW